MKIDQENSNHILADEGKIFRRIADGKLFGREVYLGYTYYLGGKKLEEPFPELPEHFEEIPMPEEYLAMLNDVKEDELWQN